MRKLRSINALLSIFSCFTVFATTPVLAQAAPSYAPSPPFIAAPYICVTNYWVDSVHGSDSNNGTTPALAKASIMSAAGLLGANNPGVCINVEPGLYSEYINLFGKGGSSGSTDSPTNYLVLRSAIPHGAKITLPSSVYGTDNHVIIGNCCGSVSNFIIIDGFEIAGAGKGSADTAGGILIQAANHVKALNNIVHDMGGAGISSTSLNDYMNWQGNAVYNAAWNDAALTSAIITYAQKPYDSKAGNHNIIANNVVYSNQFTTNNTENAGIMADNSGNEANSCTQTLIQNNLVFNNGGVGVYAYFGSATGQTCAIYIDHNTAYGNNRNTGASDNFGKGDIGVYNTATGSGATVYVTNNIAAAIPNSTWATYSCYDNVSTTPASTWKNNLCFFATPTGSSGLVGGSSSSVITTVNANRTSTDPMEPLFVQTGTNFNLIQGSQAIGNGITSTFPPAIDLAMRLRSSSSIDIGAYAFQRF